MNRTLRVTVHCTNCHLVVVETIHDLSVFGDAKSALVETGCAHECAKSAYERHDGKPVALVRFKITTEMTETP